MADPLSIESFTAWSRPLNARAAVVPSVTFGESTQTPPRYPVTVSWGAFQNPGQVSFVEAQIETSADGTTWGDRSAPQTAIAGSGNGGSLIFPTIVPGRWVRARTRSVLTNGTRGDWSAWSAGAESERVALPTPLNLPSGRQRGVAVNIATSIASLNQIILNVLVIASGPTGTTWDRRFRVQGTTAWTESGVNLPITSNVGTIDGVLGNRIYEIQARAEPNQALINLGYEASEWSASTTRNTAILATPPAPIVVATPGGMVISAPADIAGQTGWQWIYTRQGDSSFTGNTGALVDADVSDTVAVPVGTYEVRVSRSGDFTQTLPSFFSAATTVTVTSTGP